MSITLKIKNKFNTVVDTTCPKCGKEISIGYFIITVCFRCKAPLPSHTRNTIDYVTYRLDYHLGQNTC